MAAHGNSQIAAIWRRVARAHSADAGQVAALTGAYTNEAPRYLQSTGFLLDPDGRVLNAVYSSGPIGRLVPEDVVGVVTYLKSKDLMTSDRCPATPKRRLLIYERRVMAAL